MFLAFSRRLKSGGEVKWYAKCLITHTSEIQILHNSWVRFCSIYWSTISSHTLWNICFNIDSLTLICLLNKIDLCRCFDCLLWNPKTKTIPITAVGFFRISCQNMLNIYHCCVGPGFSQTFGVKLLWFFFCKHLIGFRLSSNRRMT